MTKPNPDLLQGTLDVLILKTLVPGAMHGWGIAQRIQQVSQDVLRVNQGSLYPALHRLEEEGWIAAEWGASENNRKAKFYRLTRAGQRQLEAETENWKRLAEAVGRVLQTRDARRSHEAIGQGVARGPRPVRRGRAGRPTSRSRCAITSTWRRRPTCAAACFRRRRGGPPS